METQENINVNGEATGNNVASTQEEIKTYTQEEVLSKYKENIEYYKY